MLNQQDGTGLIGVNRTARRVPVALDNAVATICPLSLIAMAELRWYTVSPNQLVEICHRALRPHKRHLPNGTCPRLDRWIGVCVEGWEISITYYPVGAVDAQSNTLVLQRIAGVQRVRANPRRVPSKQNA